MRDEIIKTNKLESIGIVACGLLYKFNNLFMIILGNDCHSMDISSSKIFEDVDYSRCADIIISDTGTGINPENIAIIFDFYN